MTEALAKKAGRRKSEVKPRVTELVERIDAKEALSVVFVPPADLTSGGPISGLTTVTGGVTIADGITTEIRLDAKDADSTKPLAETVRDCLAKLRDKLPGLAALQFGLDRAGQDAVTEIVDSFKMTTRENAVVIASTITKQMIEKAGHWPHHDRPTEFIALLRGFL